jgi:DNA (cytosine-5)-methyltransferase 1
VKKLRTLSLFAGIGGFDLGLERTGGFETVAFCEIDKKAQLVLRKHWPEVPVYGDVRELTADRLRADGVVPDVICGGFPCQDISTAGAGAGIEGARSGLWSEIARLAGDLRPRFIIVENVSALLSRGLDRVLGDLASLGFDAEWHCIPAFAVGAYHRRDRIWIVAYPNADLARLEGRNREGLPECADERAAGPLGPYLANADRQGHVADAGLDGDSSATGKAKGKGHQRQRVRPPVGRGGSAVADAKRAGLAGSAWGGVPGQGGAPIFAPWLAQGLGGQWDAEPPVGRVANGIPKRVDRLKQLGNAVVPQIPELIGRAILASLEEQAA